MQKACPAVRTCTADDASQNLTWCVLCQIYEHGRGLAFHFDKDEHLLTSERKMVHPIDNSIVYLTGDSASSRLGILELIKISHVNIVSDLLWADGGVLGKRGHEVRHMPIPRCTDMSSDALAAAQCSSPWTCLLVRLLSEVCTGSS